MHIWAVIVKKLKREVFKEARWGQYKVDMKNANWMLAWSESGYYIPKSYCGWDLDCPKNTSIMQLDWSGLADITSREDLEITDNHLNMS